MTEVVEPVFSEQLDDFLDSFQSSINAAQRNASRLPAAPWRRLYCRGFALAALAVNMSGQYRLRGVGDRGE